MATISGSIEIDRPVEEVFDFVADERNEPNYNPDLLRSSKITDGPITVGTRFTAVHRSRGRPVEMTIEITECDRPHRFGSHTSMPGTDVRGVLTFEPIGDRTRMRWTWEVRPSHLGWLLAPVVRAVGTRQERACWTGLKRYLEHQRGTSPSRGAPE
jgi:uncharacterized membrane protein